jgi:4-amino-4-deoxy-L-arabinose transferase-like glycosyltransferase
MLIAEQPVKIDQPVPSSAASSMRARPWAWKSLALILLLGAVLRGGLVWWFHGQPLYIDDERHYTLLATNLVLHGEFAYQPGRLTSLRPPLYPALVAGVYSLFGLDNHDAVRVVQAILGLATVALTYYLALHMYAATTATWAAGLVCFYPSLVGTTCLILTETLFTFLVVLFATLVAMWLQSRSLACLVAMGTVLGLAALTRSVLWLFPPFLVFFLVVMMRDQRWSRRFALAAIPLAAFAATLAPWAIRNTRLQRTFVAVDVMGGRNFMMGNYEYTPLYRAWDAISMADDRAWDSVLARAEPTYPQTTQGQRDKLALRYGLRYVFANPGQTLHRTIVKFCNFWQLERELVASVSRGNWGVGHRSVVLGLGFVIVGAYVAAMIAGIFGFVLTRPRISGMSGFVFLLIAFVCLVHSVVFGHSRYHLPLIPLLIIYAAAAIVQWREIWDRRTQKAFWLASAACLLLAGIWGWELIFVETSRLAELV